jgi:hypothetical protein
METIKRIIVWYMLKHNAIIKYNNIVVRAFTRDYYDNVVVEALGKHP